MRRVRAVVAVALWSMMACAPAMAQINTDRMLSVARTALYYDDYVLSIKYLNQVITAKPYLAEPYFYRAVAKLSLEDYRGAEQDCSSSISRNPFVVNNYEVRGLARVYQGRYDDAAQDFRTGLGYEPDNSSLRHNLILCLLRSGKNQEAVLATDTMLMLSPKYVPAMAMRSDILWEMGDTVSALEWIDKAIEQKAYDADLLHHRGVLRARLEQYEPAESDLDRSIYLDPTNAGAYITRAMIRYFRDDLNGALSDYDFAVQVDPMNTTAHYNRGNLRAQVGDDNRAIEDFDFVIKSDPNNFMAIYYRGILRYQTGDYRGAESDLTAVLNEYPQFMDGYELRSEIREKLGDRRGSEQDAMVVIREQNRRFNNAMGYSQDKQDDEQENQRTRNRSDRNVSNYRKIVVDENLENSTGFSSEFRGKVQNRNVELAFLDPFRLTYLLNRSSQASAIHSSKSLDELSANSCFCAVLMLDNKDYTLTEQIINSLFQDIDECTLRLVESQDRQACNLLARALDFCMLQDYSSALTDLDNTLALDPENWASWFCRAQVRARSIEAGNTDNRSNAGYQAVVRDLTRVTEIEPDFAYAYYNRGTFYARSNDMHAALMDFNTAIELDSMLAEAWYNRGLVFIQLNRMEEAFNDLSKAGELGLYQAYNLIKRFSNSEQ